MAKVNPWGSLKYVLEQMGRVNWEVFGAASFERRCIAVPELLSQCRALGELHVLKIDPPRDAQHRADCIQGIDSHLAELRALGPIDVLEVGLLDSLARTLRWTRESLGANSSVVLDISAMPKRYFMFLVNKLMDEPSVRDLVVTYSRPDFYPEGPLAKDHDPISAMSGLMRESDTDGETTTIIGAGFLQFSLTEYMEQANGSDLNVLFPFPPGSPSSRRNWNLLHKMDPNIEMKAAIRRVHALDFFQALHWINMVISESLTPNVDLIPLGPKPHCLAMALAYRAYPEKVSVLYAQPHSYRANYSVGVGVDPDGSADIQAYCLKRDGVELL